MENNEELENKIENLEKQKKGYDSNRNLSMVLTVFLVYITFKNYNTNPGSALYYVVMGLLILASLTIAWRDTVKINALKKEIEEALKEKPEETSEDSTSPQQ